ncbi:MAG: hypothetical protein WD872_21415 [Pirellulaceae bacterium]
MAMAIRRGSLARPMAVRPDQLILLLFVLGNSAGPDYSLEKYCRAFVHERGGAASARDETYLNYVAQRAGETGSGRAIVGTS